MYIVVRLKEGKRTVIGTFPSKRQFFRTRGEDLKKCPCRVVGLVIYVIG